MRLCPPLGPCHIIAGDAVGQAAFSGIRIQIRLEGADSVASRASALRLSSRPACKESVRQMDPRSATSVCTPVVVVRGPARSCCIVPANR